MSNLSALIPKYYRYRKSENWTAEEHQIVWLGCFFEYWPEEKLFSMWNLKGFIRNKNYFHLKYKW